MGYSPWGGKESNTTEQLSTKGHTHAQMLLLFLSPLPLLSLSLSLTHTHTHTMEIHFLFTIIQLLGPRGIRTLVCILWKNTTPFACGRPGLCLVIALQPLLHIL